MSRKKHFFLMYCILQASALLMGARASTQPRYSARHTRQQTSRQSIEQIDPILLPENIDVFGTSEIPRWIKETPEQLAQDRQEITESLKAHSPNSFSSFKRLPSPFKELVQRELDKDGVHDNPNFFYSVGFSNKKENYAVFCSEDFLLSYRGAVGFVSLRNSLWKTPVLSCLSPNSDIIAGKSYPIISYPTALMETLTANERTYAELCLSIINENIDALERFQFLKLDPTYNEEGRYAAKFNTAPFLIAGERAEKIPVKARGENEKRFALQTVLGYYVYNPKDIEYKEVLTSAQCEYAFRYARGLKVLPTLQYLDLPMRTQRPRIQKEIDTYQQTEMKQAFQTLQKGIDAELLKEFRPELGRMTPSLRIVMEKMHQLATKRIKEDLELLNLHGSNLKCLSELRSKTKKSFRKQPIVRRTMSPDYKFENRERSSY